jgi:MoaA/NifB/PqqE/SkfB family radical SAM enzyme
MKLLAVCTPTHRELAEQWFIPSIRDEYDPEIQFRAGVPASGNGDFLDEAWQTGVRLKSRVILEFIRKNPGSVFLYSDVDVRFLGPTRAAVLAALGDRDIVCQLDDPAGNLCTGLMAMRANESVHRLWSRVADAIPQYHRDQIAFNRLVRSDPGLRWGYLPEGFFGPGTFRGRLWQPGECFPIPARPLAFHANWCIGTESKAELLGMIDGVAGAGSRAIRRHNRGLSLGERFRWRNARKRLRAGQQPDHRALNPWLDPSAVRIDASTACQLRCPGCPTATGVVGQKLGTGFLRFDDFVRFLENHPKVQQIELSNWGEAFLNPDLVRILRHGDENGIALTMANGANLNRATPEALEAVVRHRLRYLSCSIDGASQETYAAYRVNGDFERVIGHIRRIQELKARYRSRYPVLRWQFVAFGHNEHEIATARDMARELGMEFHLKLAWDDLYGAPQSPIRDREAVRKAGGSSAADRREYEDVHGRHYIEEACHQMWTSPQINTDGRVLGCTINHSHDYGNAFRDGLDTVLAADSMQRARGMLMGLVDPQPDIPCSNCSVYAYRRQHRRWVDPARLATPHVPGERPKRGGLPLRLWRWTCTHMRRRVVRW